MPTAEYTKLLYPKFGIKEYHDEGNFGQRTSIYIIDTGLTNTPNSLANVHNRNITNPMARKNTHGSFVASIIAQKPGGGHSGIAPQAEIYLADVSNEDGVIYTSSLVKAIRDAVDLKVDIISISLGTDVYDQHLEDVVKLAQKKNILVVAASGNCGCRTYEFPSSCDSAISVASMDQNRLPSSFNTRNDAVAVFAPGQNLKVPGSDSRLSGTSFAVPFASGLLALELSRRRQSNPKSFMGREEAISVLRVALGLDCGLHTYANDVCSGKFSGGAFGPPHGSDGLKWFLIISVLGAAVAFYCNSKF